MKKVLIIEDNLDELELFQEILKDEFKVSTAGDGEKGLEKMNEDIDIVLLDRMMPGMDGGEVLREIRENQNPEISQTPVILLTALDADLDIIDMEFNDYINKPVSPKQLRKKVRETISISEYDKQIDRYYSIINKIETLKESLDEDVLNQNKEYQKLKQKKEKRRKEVDDSLQKLMQNIPPEKTEEFHEILEKLL
ncbi:response regulator transcription factor [Methanonatronarchaeum sp. AMET6-2]|uniref:response regulator transcription factor n=1 Tax=Methanonatronarchaeum sp. AMET6-2 TaxID=2933293 RepID=UPI0011F444D7|nr:response regulator transcription factor [Methanonatronarchaeum sp. AMET6-2]RZN62078.1 MAG: response regulator transcription factor [Methanonatronarchaeia archaeon]UOY09775.1 response regulator transcription factor [Methanonatronarchaeum sp. AMET6-2]